MGERAEATVSLLASLLKKQTPRVLRPEVSVAVGGLYSAESHGDGGSLQSRPRPAGSGPSVFAPKDVLLHETARLARRSLSSET